MPTFDILPLNQARANSATGQRAALLQEYMGYAPVMRCWTILVRPTNAGREQACVTMCMRGLLSLSVWFTSGGSEGLLHV